MDFITVKVKRLTSNSMDKTQGQIQTWEKILMMWEFFNKGVFWIYKLL